MLLFYTIYHRHATIHLQIIAYDNQLMICLLTGVQPLVETIVGSGGPAKQTAGAAVAAAAAATDQGAQQTPVTGRWGVAVNIIVGRTLVVVVQRRLERTLIEVEVVVVAHIYREKITRFH